MCVCTCFHMYTCFFTTVWQKWHIYVLLCILLLLLQNSYSMCQMVQLKAILYHNAMCSLTHLFFCRLLYMHFIQFQNIFVGTLNGIILNIVINSSTEVLYSSWINFGSLYFAVLSLVQYLACTLLLLSKYAFIPLFIPFSFILIYCTRTDSIENSSKGGNLSFWLPSLFII